MGMPLLMDAMHEIRKQGTLSEDAINQWLDSFLLSRMGTEMLTTQYIACTNPGGAMEGRTGIVHRRCNPAQICEQAAERAQRLCAQHFRGKAGGVRIVVEIAPNIRTDPKQTHFPYVPQYLFYIVLELLKNSARATVETAADPLQIPERPITITVSADSHQVAIRIEDRAGGIPFESAQRIWSYMYSTAPSRADSWEHKGTPLAGYGVGLPISRLYACYLGGSLHVMSMPGQGTSAYICLQR